MQDVRTGTVPAAARLARVSVISTSASGAPDGYVDLVSLDVVDSGLSIPTVASADPPDQRVGVDPVVKLQVKLQDRSSAVVTNSIRLFLDDAQVTPLIEKNATNTVVSYLGGSLPALSSHSYQIVFGDTSSPSVVQTNTFHFTVVDYMTLPSALSTPIGSGDASQPGFNVAAFQIDALESGDPAPAQVNIPSSVGFAEALLAGQVRPNVAELAGAVVSNRFAIPGVINWIDSSGATANFPNDQAFPGIPGTTGTEDNFVHEIETYLQFPTAGFYRMGINNEDFFRLTAATGGVQVLSITAPTNTVIAAVPIATNILQLNFGTHSRCLRSPVRSFTGRRAAIQTRLVILEPTQPWPAKSCSWIEAQGIGLRGESCASPNSGRSGRARDDSGRHGLPVQTGRN